MQVSLAQVNNSTTTTSKDKSEQQSKDREDYRGELNGADLSHVGAPGPHLDLHPLT